MPLYEYECAACHRRYEKREGFDAPAKQKCQFCGRAGARRVLHAPPVVFKGSGFYKTDSRGKSAGSGSSSTSTTDTEAAAPAARDDSSSKGDAPSSTPKPLDAGATETAAAG